MEGQRFNTDKVGYLVLSKQINKETVAYCSKCNHKREGRHKTCDKRVETTEPSTANNKVGKDGLVRCEGDWIETVELKPLVQVMIEKKTDSQVQHVMEDQSNIIVGMKNHVVYKNTSKCLNWYGNKCPYYNLCHKDSNAGLVKED